VHAKAGSVTDDDILEGGDEDARRHISLMNKIDAYQRERISYEMNVDDSLDLSYLRERDREFLLRNIVDGETHVQIAKSAGISKARVSQIIERAKERVRENWVRMRNLEKAREATRDALVL
jgi:DNA-directed RNA polymerase specialized sigma subunit